MKALALYPQEPRIRWDYADINTLLLWATNSGMSDLLLRSGSCAWMRLYGQWRPITQKPITTDELLYRKEEIKRRIQNLIDKSIEVKFEIYEVIDHIDDYRFAEVLEAYFIECKTLECIADEKHYSVRHISSLYSEGLKEIQINE